MIVVEYRLFHKGQVARQEYLYYRSIRAAKQHLSRMAAKIWNLTPAGTWKQIDSGHTRQFLGSLPSQVYSLVISDPEVMKGNSQLSLKGLSI